MPAERRHGAGRAPARGRAGGFTLLEVLVALAVLALALFALSRSAALAVEAAGHREQALLAGTVAGNVLASLRLEPSTPAPGRREGQQEQGGRTSTGAPRSAAPTCPASSGSRSPWRSTRPAATSAPADRFRGTAMSVDRASRVRTRGFTLVELLVALAVFAAMAAIAQAALTAVVSTRAALDLRGKAVDATARTLAMIERDLRAVVARPVRADLGARLPALVAGEGGLELSTLGRGGAGDASAARLERVGYQLGQGRLERLRWPAPDRADGTRPDRAPCSTASSRCAGASWHSMAAGMRAGRPRAQARR